MKRIVFVFLLVIFVLCRAVGQITVKVDLAKNSWLSITGTTNLISFKLSQAGDKILGKSVSFNATQNQNRIFLSQNQLSLLAKNFGSDNPMALRDFLKLIKSDKYPAIKAQLNYIETQPGTEKDSYSKGVASVGITITGVTRQYSIPVSSVKRGDVVVITGGKKMSIRDFGLEPPVEMMGLIKVSEWISIDFKMICHITLNGAVVGGDN